MAAGDARRKGERTTVHLKNKSVAIDESKTTLLLSLLEQQVLRKVSGKAMYTAKPPICIPKPLSGEPAPVNTQKTEVFCCIRKRVVSLGFCCGGFSSTAGYVPGNEAQVRRHERHSSQRLFLSDGCYSFLSEQLGEPEGSA